MATFSDDRMIQIRAALVARIDAIWTKGPDDSVLEPYVFQEDMLTFTGRRVLVFHDSYASVPSSKADDLARYTFQIWVLERYTGQGIPPNSWVNERIRFVASINDQIGDSRAIPNYTPLLPSVPEVYAESMETTVVYDAVELSENKLFLSTLSLTLAEEVDGE